MNLERKYEISQKQLKFATDRVENLEKRLDKQNQKLQEAQNLINILHDMQNEWHNILLDLEDKKEEYTILIKQLKMIYKQ